IAVAKNRKFATARGISNERASEIGFPVSIDSARANFSRSRSIKSATCKRNRERSAAGFFDQLMNAFSAAAAATSTSRASLSATCEYGLPVAGSILSTYFPLIGSTNSPSMKFWIWSDSVHTGLKEKLNADSLTSNAEHPISLQRRRRGERLFIRFGVCTNSA